jgi:hypothetical protein
MEVSPAGGCNFTKRENHAARSFNLQNWRLGRKRFLEFDAAGRNDKKKLVQTCFLFALKRRAVSMNRFYAQVVELVDTYA